MSESRSQTPQQPPSSALVRATDGAVTGFRHPILLATTDDLPGHSVVRVIGVVRGNSVRARHVGRDVLALFRNVVGGEIRDYTKLLAESREQAIDRMVEQAVSLGANAVTGMRFTTSMVMGGAAELLAYGTAKVVDPGPR
jgi:uncharacterized protein YbjQ (UPF0145 family)